MTRDEMLDKLHSIRIGAQPTVATMDMGLEYEYVTSEGYGEAFGGMGNWPAYKLENITSKQLEAIKEKIQNKTLTMDDLADTDLELFYNHVFSVNRPEEYIPDIFIFFEGLALVSLSEENIIYALCDSLDWEPSAFFCSAYNELEAEFAGQYIYDIEEWETLDDDELENWIEHIESSLDGIPFISLREEDEV